MHHAAERLGLSIKQLQSVAIGGYPENALPVFVNRLDLGKNIIRIFVPDK
jgi:hypothetical protein